MTDASPTGRQGPGSSTSLFNQVDFMIRQLIGKVNVATLVKVLAVTGDGGVSPVGFVDVQPLVNQVDGAGNYVAHGPVYRLPYLRVQGGADAIILDPKVGDVGMAAIGDRDLSAVKASKAQANPGSFRRFSLADGMYCGGFLNGTPTQYVRFSADGVEVVSPTKVTIVAPVTEVQGDLQVTGNVLGGYGGAGQVGLQTHTHDQATDSHGDTEAPTDAPNPGT